VVPVFSPFLKPPLAETAESESGTPLGADRLAKRSTNPPGGVLQDVPTHKTAE